MKLVIGNKNYSSWSLRPWLLLDYYLLDFEEINVSLKLEGLSERLAKYSATKKVPVLLDNELVIWDSLAICEYVSEAYLKGKAWPENNENRAIARAIVAEMHAGFSNIRNELPMNCRAKRKVELSQAAKNEVIRIDEIWTKYAKKDKDGQLFLFGNFGIADCFFAPVVFRFLTYGVEVSETSIQYIKSMMELESIKKWLQAAIKEDEIIPRSEVGTK
jgi:glutathione S-transferase